MKKLLILIVAGALYLHFYPNEKLNTWLSEQKTMVLGVFSEATDTNVRLNAKKVYQDIQQEFAHFNAKEEAYIAEITTDRKSIKAFYYGYCSVQKQTPKLHRKNLKRVCKIIENYKKFF